MTALCTPLEWICMRPTILGVQCEYGAPWRGRAGCCCGQESPRQD
ncbi:hypothetical protein E2C01_097502 [Portunus trituberculatus]|uniref:Uncharacterized protein n=1 Tax=Portunus trituberculatus TaxID=210409 RepID=A0A5B7JYN1_PORTR|nr:hypothetical protein [Portunus trituberculatus]